MDDLTAFQRDLLYAIAGADEPHGLALKEELQEYYQSEVTHGHLYPTLDALVEMELVEKGSLDDRTNSYTLTDRGEAVLASRREWEDEYVSDVVETAPSGSAGGN